MVPTFSGKKAKQTSDGQEDRLPIAAENSPGIAHSKVGLT